MDTSKYKGIVLHSIPYSDSKNIVKIYTPTGTNAYIAFRSSKKSYDALRPMTLVNFCSGKKGKSNFAFLKDVEYINSTMGVNYQLPKATVSMFLNEVLYKLLLNAGEDEPLFSFIYKAIDDFCTQDFVPDFHLRFLLHSAINIGVAPVDNYKENCVFDIISASFELQPNATKEQKETAYWLFQLMQQEIYPSNHEQIVPSTVRNSLLDCLLSYYTLHIVDLSKMKSLEILKSILHD